jgi:mono/diheme cytochrome c family protein
MKKFIFGFITAVVLLGLGGLAFALLGLINTDADRAPSHAEEWIASQAMDASMQRHAPHDNNPVPATDANLIDGMKLYSMDCSGCHGGLDRKPSPFGANFFPIAPQLIMDPPDDPEWHIAYAIRHGLRNTGMPAWKGQISEEDIWKLTAFLSRIEKLPPAVQDQWKKSVASSAPAAP